MTAADHANTIRGRGSAPGRLGEFLLIRPYELDALVAQAETAAGAQHVREALIAEADACRARMEAAEAERDRWKDMAGLRRRRQLEAEAEARLLREEVRIREESQIPMIPRAAQARLEAAEAERDALRRCKMRAIDARNECDSAPQDFFLQDIERIARAALGEDR